MRHYHQQALGSVTEISDPSGAVVEWVTYDVYGAATIRDQAGSTASSSAVGSPFLFTGREYDADSGLYHYRARAYDPAGGRFLQRDPLGYVDGLNDREYVSSRPAGLRDPGGTKSDGPPAPIRVKYPKSSNPDPAAAAAEDKAAAKKAVDDWNKANPDNPVPKDVADSIGDPLGKGHVGGLTHWRLRCRVHSQDRDGTRFHRYEFEWDELLVIVEPDDGSLSDHENGHVEVTEKARQDANEEEAKKDPRDVGEETDDEREAARRKAEREAMSKAKQANDTYDERTAHGKEQGKYKGGGDPTAPEPRTDRPAGGR